MAIIPPMDRDPQHEIDELSEKLRRFQHEYYIDNRPTASDAEYDRLFDRLQELERTHPELVKPDSPTHRVGSDLASELPEVNHTIPVLSLDKAYSAEEVVGWMRKLSVQARRDLSFTVEEKIDGISIVLYYREGLLERAVTRGNGLVGNDVTANVRTIAAVPLRLPRPVTVAVRGEIYLPLDRFDELNSRLEQPFANPRNLAAGTIRRVKSAEVARVPLNIFVYEGFFTPPLESHTRVLEELKALGFRLNPRSRVFSTGADPSGLGELFETPEPTAGLDAVKEYLETAARERSQLPYEIDGLVIKVNQAEVREALGYTGHHPRWALAYKFESPQGETRVTAIEIQVGRSGRITPVARVEPVLIGGSTISNVTLHNQDYINLLELAVGDRVAVSKRGDVIPAVEGVLEKNEEGYTTYQIPSQCPSCGTRLVLKGAHHFCPNPDCPDQIRGRLFFFVGKKQMDLENLGPETMEVLIRQGLVRDIQDIYTFDPESLLGQPGFGEKKVAAIKAGIEASKKRPFRRVLASLGIPELGLRGAELLVEGGFSSLEALYAAVEAGDPSAFTGIDGIGEVTADIIIRELSRPEVKARLRGLKEAGLSLEETSSAAPKEDQIFQGQTWCVTGSFDNFKPRSQAEEEIKKRGGKVVSAVTGKTTHLLTGEGGGSKREKALEAGAVLVDEGLFLSLLRGEAQLGSHE